MDKLQELCSIEDFDVTFLVTLSLRSELPVQIRVTGAYSTGKVHPESHRRIQRENYRTIDSPDQRSESSVPVSVHYYLWNWPERELPVTRWSLTEKSFTRWIPAGDSMVIPGDSLVTRGDSLVTHRKKFHAWIPAGDSLVTRCDLSVIRCDLSRWSQKKLSIWLASIGSVAKRHIFDQNLARSRGLAERVPVLRLL